MVCLFWSRRGSGGHGCVIAWTYKHRKLPSTELLLERILLILVPSGARYSIKQVLWLSSSISFTTGTRCTPLSFALHAHISRSPLFQMVWAHLMAGLGSRCPEFSTPRQGSFETHNLSHAAQVAPSRKALPLNSTKCVKWFPSPFLPLLIPKQCLRILQKHLFSCFKTLGNTSMSTYAYKRVAVRPYKYIEPAPWVTSCS